MRFKNIEPKLMTLNEISSTCGLLYSSENYSYACKSTSEGGDGKQQCLNCNCPLAYSVDLAEMKKFDMYLYNEYKSYDDIIERLENGDNEEDIELEGGETWMIQYREVVEEKNNE